MPVRFQFDMDRTGQHALVAQAGGRSHLIAISPNDDMGKPIQIYMTKDIEPSSKAHQLKANYAFGAIFTANDDLVVFGSIGPRILVWSREDGKILGELHHGKGMYSPFTLLWF